MINKLKILLVFIWGASINLASAEGEDNELKNMYKSLLPEFQNLSPEASALGQFGTHSVSGYTGTPSISVPLFSVGSGSFSMPFELNYDASGIKVEQQATYVGLGWNLSLGGSITQIIGGKNDFEQRTMEEEIVNSDLLLPFAGLTNNTITPIGNDIRVRLKKASSCRVDYYEAESADYRKNIIMYEVFKGIRVPDIFQASFCGHSVSFVIDTENKTAKIIGHDATKYKIELLDYGYLYPRSIKITDDYGLQYIFDAFTENSMHDGGYYLTQVKDASERCLVKIEYEKEVNIICGSYYESIGEIDENYARPADASIERQFLDHNCPEKSSLWNRVVKYNPISITTDKEIVSISYSKGKRTDIEGANWIDSITIKSLDGRATHKAVFVYGYFLEQNNDPSLTAKYGYYPSYKRLKLTEVIVDGKKYSFEYYNDNKLPSRLSKEQDFWGYYNGQVNTEGFCASPEFRFDDAGNIEGQRTIGPANRFSSESFCKIGTLNKIIYPTGGYSLFDYEINHFDDISGNYYYPSATSLSIVKNIKTVTCGSGYGLLADGKYGYKSTPDTKEFEVEEPLKLRISSNIPKYTENDKYYKFTISIVGKDANGTPIFSKTYVKFSHEDDIDDTIQIPQGHYALSTQFESVTDGLKIGGQVLATFPPVYQEDSQLADASGKSIGCGLRIKTIENYGNDNALLGCTRYRYEGGKLLIPTVKKERITMHWALCSQLNDYFSTDNMYYVPYDCSFFFVTSSPSYPSICSLGSSNIGYSKVIKESYDKDRTLLSYNVETYHNNAYNEIGDPHLNLFFVNMDGMNGKMESMVTYSKDNKPQHSIDYSYKNFDKPLSIEETTFFPFSRKLTSQCDAFGYIDYTYSLYPKWSVCVLPDSVVETSYANGESMKPVSTTYKYKESNYQPIEVTKTFSITDSQRNVTKTNYWYPDDAVEPSSNTEPLINAHKISEQVKAMAYNNGNIVGGYRNCYRSLTNGLPVVSENYSITSNGSEIKELSVDKYDNYGNIIQYTKKDGVPTTIIWSYNHQCPVLQIVGAKYADIESDVSSLESASTLTIAALKSAHTKICKPGRMVTAYLYDAWYGVSDIIAPNGKINHYSRDNYGRLSEIRENSNNGPVIQRYFYNYQNQ